jgi:hypothetical protein
MYIIYVNIVLRAGMPLEPRTTVLKLVPQTALHGFTALPKNKRALNKEAEAMALECFLSAVCAKPALAHGPGRHHFHFRYVDVEEQKAQGGGGGGLVGAGGGGGGGRAKHIL